MLLSLSSLALPSFISYSFIYYPLLLSLIPCSSLSHHLFFPLSSLALISHSLLFPLSSLILPPLIPCSSLSHPLLFPPLYIASLNYCSSFPHPGLFHPSPRAMLLIFVQRVCRMSSVPDQSSMTGNQSNQSMNVRSNDWKYQKTRSSKLWTSNDTQADYKN